MADQRQAQKAHASPEELEIVRDEARLKAQEYLKGLKISRA